MLPELLNTDLITKYKMHACTTEELSLKKRHIKYAILQ